MSIQMAAGLQPTAAHRLLFLLLLLLLLLLLTGVCQPVALMAQVAQVAALSIY